jgi:hypothetical protein
MPLTWIDVIDSAVKIGLGAVISGFATYQSIKSDHANEKNKELRTHKLKTLEVIGDNCEQFFNSYSNYRSKLGGVLKKRTTDEEYVLGPEAIKALKGVDESLFSALERARVALSRLNLMRAEKARTDLKTIIGLIADIRNPIMHEHKAPSKKALEKFSTDFKEATASLNNELAALYERIS